MMYWNNHRLPAVRLPGNDSVVTGFHMQTFLCFVHIQKDLILLFCVDTAYMTHAEDD